MLKWLAFTVILLVVTIFAGVRTYWQDIVAQPDSAAAFLGALAGAGGGLLAIILGALLNAELNRHRDDRLRDEQRKAVAVEVQADMVALLAQAMAAESTIVHWVARGAQMPRGDLLSMELPPREFLQGPPGQFGVLGPDLCFEIAQAHVWLANIRQSFAALRLDAIAMRLDARALEVHEANFAALTSACRRAVEALEAVTGKSIRRRISEQPGDPAEQAGEAAANRP